jgi:hypothetical protein
VEQVLLYRIPPLTAHQLCDVAPGHDNHLLTERALHEQVQNVPAHVASGAQQHRRVVDLGHQYQEQSRFANGVPASVGATLRVGRDSNQHELRHPFSVSIDEGEFFDTVRVPDVGYR